MKREIILELALDAFILDLMGKTHNQIAKLLTKKHNVIIVDDYAEFLIDIEKKIQYASEIFRT